MKSVVHGLSLSEVQRMIKEEVTAQIASLKEEKNEPNKKNSRPKRNHKGQYSR